MLIQTIRNVPDRSKRGLFCNRYHRKMFYCNIKNKLKFYGLPNNMTFSKTEPEWKIQGTDMHRWVRQNCSRYSQILHNWLHLHVGAAQLGAASTRCGTNCARRTWAAVVMVSAVSGVSELLLFLRLLLLVFPMFLHPGSSSFLMWLAFFISKCIHCMGYKKVTKKHLWLLSISGCDYNQYWLFNIPVNVFFKFFQSILKTNRKCFSTGTVFGRKKMRKYITPQGKNSLRIVRMLSQRVRYRVEF